MEAQHLERLLHVLLTVDAMMLSICAFFPFDAASSGLYVSVELPFVLLSYSVLKLGSCLPLHELVTSDSKSTL